MSNPLYPMSIAMQQAGEKMTGSAALGSAVTEFMGINLTPYESGNLIITSIMGVGWFFFKWRDMRRADRKLENDKMTEGTQNN